MASDNLTYQKQPGKTPLRKPIAVVPNKQPKQGTTGAQTPYSKDHEKGQAVLVPAIVYVLSGGTTREKVFFQALRNDKILSSCVQVLFQSKEGQGLQPYQMEEIWQRGRQRGKITVEGKEYRLSKVDKVFLVTDVDEFESQLVKILSQKAKVDYGQWIISNPCIEIWLYYCYEKNLAPELLQLRYVSRARRSQRLKQLNNDLILGMMLSAPFSVRPLRFLLGNKVTAFLSAISMNYYLTHQTIAVHLRRIGFPASVSESPNMTREQPWQTNYTLTAFGISLAMALLITYLVEKPAGRLIDHWNAKKNGAS